MTKEHQKQSITWDHEKKFCTEIMLSKNIQISLFNVMKIKAKKLYMVVSIRRNKQKLFRYHPNM